MAKKWHKKNKRGRKHSTTNKIKSIVKHEVNKTREVQKLLSYLSFSNIPILLDGTTVLDSHGLILSLTGGLQPPQDQEVQDPGVYTDKLLFMLLPGQDPSANIQGVNNAGYAGMSMNKTSLVITNDAVGGVHQLEGREAFLKDWYVRMIISNSAQVVTDPRPCFVRMFVIETYRPLAALNVAQQIFYQQGAVETFTPGAVIPKTVTSYINRDVVKKVYYDNTITLTGPSGTDAGGSSKQLYSKKLKIKINKKCKWAYYYRSSNPAIANDRLVYQGPFIYMVFCSDQGTLIRQPQMALSTMLTFYDD